jgi:endoribonuclease Dicer
VESLAGAVFLDSNFDLDTVWHVFKQILRPLVTPETLRLEPIRELRELCQHEKFGELKFTKERGVKGDFIMTVTVKVKHETISKDARKPDKKSAKKVAALRALEALKVKNTSLFL